MKASTKADFWRDELGYIKSVDIRAPGGSFNCDADCFARYCDMQANAAQADGFSEVANEIRGRAVAALYHAREQRDRADLARRVGR